MRRAVTAEVRSAVASSGRVATLFLVAAALLAGCAGPPRRGPDAAALARQEAREAQLGAQTRWTLQGRMAVSGGGDAGSGQLTWVQDGDSSLLDMRAPVSRQTWRLSARPGEARLEGLEGGTRRGDDAEALLQSELGWSIPLADLGAWARGMRGDGPARIEFDGDGLPSSIEQHGWRIEYRGWDHSTSPPLPNRVFASREDRRVRLAVSRWDLGA